MTERNDSSCPFPDCGYTASSPQLIQSHMNNRHEIHPGIEITIRQKQVQDGERKVMIGQKALRGCDKCRTHLGEKLLKYLNLCCSYSERGAKHLQVHQGFSRRGGQTKFSQEAIWSTTGRSHASEISTRMETASAAQTMDKISTPFVDKISRARLTEVSNKEARMERDVRYSCTICPYTSKWRANLIRHLMVHTDHKPFSCPINGCNYRSKWSQCVREHCAIARTVELPPKKPLKTKDKLKSFTYACMLCEFIGDSEVSALKHSQQHVGIS